MNKWIPVSEALPPEPEGFKFVPVLAYWTGGDESPADVDSSVYTGNRQWQRANGSMDYHGGHGRVTHWMERPEPPTSAPDSSDALLEAAKDVVRRWDTPTWKDAEPTGAVINRLRVAIATKEQR